MTYRMYSEVVLRIFGEFFFWSMFLLVSSLGVHERENKVLQRFTFCQRKTTFDERVEGRERLFDTEV